MGKCTMMFYFVFSWLMCNGVNVGAQVIERIGKISMLMNEVEIIGGTTEDLANPLPFVVLEFTKYDPVAMQIIDTERLISFVEKGLVEAAKATEPLKDDKPMMEFADDDSRFQFESKWVPKTNKSEPVLILTVRKDYQRCGVVWMEHSEGTVFIRALKKAIEKARNLADKQKL